MQLFDRFLRLLALAAGFVLLLLTLVTVLDVVMRYVFNRPLASAWEFTEFSMALIVFLSIAYCGWTGGHIAVDVLQKWLDRPSLRFLPALIAFIGAALFALIAYRALLETLATFNQISNTLRWPHYPFRLTAAFGSAVFAVVMLLQGLRSLRRKANGEHPHAP
jgi:TRAP-type C4-dicarboxylate transport system permease small subunit